MGFIHRFIGPLPYYWMIIINALTYQEDFHFAVGDAGANLDYRLQCWVMSPFLVNHILSYHYMFL